MPRYAVDKTVDNHPPRRINMTALEKFILRRRQDRIGPDALMGPVPQYGRTQFRMRKSDGRPVFRDHILGSRGKATERTVAA